MLIAESDLVALVPLDQSFIVIKLGGEPEILVVEFLGFFGLIRESPLKLLDQACVLRGGAIVWRWSAQVLDCIRVLVFLRHARLLRPSKDSHRAHKVNRARKINYLCRGRRSSNLHGGRGSTLSASIEELKTF